MKTGSNLSFAKNTLLGAVLLTFTWTCQNQWPPTLSSIPYHHLLQEPLPKNTALAVATSVNEQTLYLLPAFFFALLAMTLKARCSIQLYIVSNLHAVSILERILDAQAKTTDDLFTVCYQTNPQIFLDDGSSREIIVFGFQRGSHGLCGELVLKIVPSISHDQQALVSAREWLTLSRLFPGIESIVMVDVSLMGSFEQSVTMLREAKAASSTILDIVYFPHHDSQQQSTCLATLLQHLSTLDESRSVLIQCVHSGLRLFRLHLQNMYRLQQEININFPRKSCSEVEASCFMFRNHLNLNQSTEYLQLDDKNLKFPPKAESNKNYSETVGQTLIQKSGANSSEIFSNPIWMRRYGLLKKKKDEYWSEYLESTSVPERCSARSWRCFSSSYPMLLHSSTGMTCLSYTDKMVTDHLLLDLVHSILSSQLSDGGWWKDSSSRHNYSTIDNGATIKELYILAFAFERFPVHEIQTAFERGVTALKVAQQSNGCWSQIFLPKCLARLQTKRRRQYRCHVAFNDNTMINVINFLWDLVLLNPPFRSNGLLPPRLHPQILQVLSSAIDCVLKTRHEDTGLWASYYDEESLAPAAGRAYEPIALSTPESVSMVNFLMKLHLFLYYEPQDELARARNVDDEARYHRNKLRPVVTRALAEFVSEVKLAQCIEQSYFTLTALALHFQQIDVEDVIGEVQDSYLVANASRWIWARFYNVKTNEAVFGDRDGTTTTDFPQISRERRANYCWFNDNARPLICDKILQWRRLTGGRNQSRHKLCDREENSDHER